MSIGYPVFIMVSLAVELGLIGPDEPYDIQWGKALQLYGEFVSSQYNRFTLSEYTCIELFLKDRKKKVPDDFFMSNS